MSAIFKDIDLTPMYLYCKAADGKIACLYLDKTKHETVPDEKGTALLMEGLTLLTDSFNTYIDSQQQDTVHAYSNRINVLQNELNIYENCLYVLAYTRSEVLQEIINSSEYQINLPEWGSNNYAKELETANNKLGKLRNLIQRTHAEYKRYLKANGIEIDNDKTNTDSFLESMHTISRWQGYRDNSYEITMKEYGIALKMLKKENEKAK